MFWLAGIALALAAAPEGSPAVRAEVVQGLLPRDGAIACADLAPEVDAATRRAALVQVAETVQRPPWVPVRAAGCVAEQAGRDPVARAAAERWLADPGTFGLALAVLDHLDRLDGVTAIRLAGDAVDRAKRESRFALYARPALARSRYPPVRAKAAILGE